MESPTYPDTPTRLSDYQQIEFNFGNLVATGGGILGRPNFQASEEVWMNQGGAEGTFSTPSNPSGDNEGFYVTWTSGAANQVFPPGPWIQTTSLPPAQINQPYNQTLAVNQAATPVWTLVGTLPPYLTLSPQGTLSGSSLVSGLYHFAVFATDTTTGAFTAQQNLVIDVETTPASSLEVDCGGILPPASGTALALTVDGAAAPCNVASVLSLGTHTVVATVSGTTKPYKITYAGACNSTGQITLVSGTVAICSVSAVGLGTSEGACPSGQHCCEPSANGCLKCLPAKNSCP